MVVFSTRTSRQAGGRSVEPWARPQSNSFPRANVSSPGTRPAAARALPTREAPPYRPTTVYGCPQSSSSSIVWESGRAVISTSSPRASSSSTSGRRTRTWAEFVRSTQTRTGLTLSACLGRVRLLALENLLQACEVGLEHLLRLALDHRTGELHHPAGLALADNLDLRAVARRREIVLDAHLHRSGHRLDREARIGLELDDLDRGLHVAVHHRPFLTPARADANGAVVRAVYLVEAVLPGREVRRIGDVREHVPHRAVDRDLVLDLHEREPTTYRTRDSMKQSRVLFG